MPRHNSATRKKFCLTGPEYIVHASPIYTTQMTLQKRVAYEHGVICQHDKASGLSAWPVLNVT